MRIVAAIALVAVTLGGARPADAAGELTVTTAILHGSPALPTTEVRRNEPVTVKVTVTNTTAAVVTLTGLTLSTLTGLEGTAVVPLPPSIPANSAVDVMVTGLSGSMNTGATVSVAATVTGTVPDASVATLPADPDTDPDPVTATSAPATLPLVDYTVRTEILRGGAPALNLVAGDQVTVRVIVLSDLPTTLTIPVNGVVLTTTNLTGTASNTTVQTVPARPATGPVPFNIDIPGFVAGPGSPATASAVVNGTVPDNTIKPNDPQNDDDPVTANNTASPDSVPVGTFSATIRLAHPDALGVPAAAFFAGSPVTVQVTVTSNLPQSLTIGAGDVTLTTTNLSGTANPSPLTVIAPGPQTTTINITGLTAGPGTPASATAVVNGLLPDGTLTPTNGSPDPIVTTTPTPASAPVVSPTFTFTGNPAPGAGEVPRGETVVVTATVTNPANAPTMLAGTFVITAPDKTTITAAPIGSTTLGNTVTMVFPTIAPGASASVEVTTQLNLDAAKVDGPANDFVYTATFASVSLAAPLAVANLAYEISPNADIQMLVNAPATEARDPSQANVEVQYQVRNVGPDTAAGISFVATAPAGAIGSPSVSEGADWTCNEAGGNVTCTYDPGTLVKDGLTATVLITWRFNAVGVKTFSATASSTTTDPAVGNNTAEDTTEVVNPSSTVNVVSANATPDPVIVAIDRDASVAVEYVIRNTGTKNLTIRATATAPAGATLLTLTGTGGATCSVATASCDVQVNKNGGEVTINATYTVPQASFSGSPPQANFTVAISALDGGTLDPGSVTTLSDFVVGEPPVIDIGLAPIAGDPVVNVPFGTVSTATHAVARTITFQNFSTEFSVRANTLSIELELTNVPANGIDIPVAGDVGGVAVSCTEVPASSPRRLTCPIPNAVAAAAVAPTPTTLDLNIVLRVKTVDEITFTARAVVNDPANRRIQNNPFTPDSQTFKIDINRIPKDNNEVGPGIPSGGVMQFTPVGNGKLHEDTDGDVLTVAALEAPACPGATGCEISGGTVSGLTYAVSNNVITVTFNGAVVPAVPGNPVTAKINYTVSDGKITVPSSLKVKLLDPVKYEGARAVPGSFGTPQSPAPRSFGEEVSAARMGITPTTLELLEGALGNDANGAAFPARNYDVNLADVPTPPDATSLNVARTLSSGGSPETGVDVVESELLPATTPPRHAVRYVPPRAYTSDAPITANVGLEAAPPDSFKYRTLGRIAAQSIYTVDIPVSLQIRNQNPIGIDSPFDVPNGVTQKVFPANNDLDGNTLATKIKTKVPDKEFVFDDEGDLADPPGDRRLRIKCIGPMPTTKADLDNLLLGDPFSTCPSQDVNPPAPGWKRAGEALVLETTDSRGKVTVTLEGGTGADALRGVTLSADATVVGELDFVYVVVDNYGGAGFAKATARVPNTPPQVIEGVRTVLKNTPTVVVDTRLAAQDANGDTIEVSGTSERTQHGTTKIGDNNRTITYTPDRDYLGPDKLLYNVSDGRADGAASAELQINVIEQPGAITDAGGTGSGAGGSGSPAGNLAATGGDPLALTFAAGCALVLGLALLQAGKRRSSLPLLDRARHLRT